MKYTWLFLIWATVAHALTLPLLEFRYINDVKIIVDYETIQVPINNFMQQSQLLLKDLNNFECETMECRTEKRQLLSGLQEKNADLFFLKHTDNSLTLKRRKRWDALGAGLKTIAGVMDAEDRQSIIDKVYKLNDQVQETNKKVDQVMEKLNEPQNLKVEDLRVDDHAADLKILKEKLKLYEFQVKIIEVKNVLDGLLKTSFSKKLDANLISKNLLEFLQNEQLKLGGNYQFACDKMVDCLRNSEADVKYENQELKIIMRLPITERNSLQLYETRVIPAEANKSVLIFEPAHKFIATAPNDELFAFGENFLQQCVNYDNSSALFCKSNDIENASECLLKAFKDTHVYTDICSHTLNMYKVKDFAIFKLDGKRFWIYSEDQVELSVDCWGIESTMRNISGSEILHLDSGCQGEVNGIKLRSSYGKNINDVYFTANISEIDFISIVEHMEHVSVENGVYNLNSLPHDGLKKKPVVRAAFESDKLTVIKAQHNEALLILLFLTAVAFIIFIVVRKVQLLKREENVLKLSYECDKKMEAQ